MPEFVYDIPLRSLAIYLALIAVAAMLVGLLIVKPILRLLLGAPPDLNESIGYGTAGFSLFYGLLLGLLTVSAYQNNERVKQAILAEASALGALYADMGSYPEPIRSEMKAMMRDYVLFTVHRDWEAHRQGEFLNGGSNRTNAMRQRLARFEPATRGPGDRACRDDRGLPGLRRGAAGAADRGDHRDPRRALVRGARGGGDQPAAVRDAADAAGAPSSSSARSPPSSSG